MIFTKRVGVIIQLDFMRFSIQMYMNGSKNQMTISGPHFFGQGVVIIFS